MTDDTVYAKTAAGVAEIKARGNTLPARLRTMLIMVDGVRTLAQLVSSGVTLGAPPNFMQALLDLGLVEPGVAQRPSAAGAAAARTTAHVVDVEIAATTDAANGPGEVERFRAAQKFVNDSAVDALGLRAFFFTLKIEKTQTRGDVRALLPEFARAIAKQRGEEAGRSFLLRAQQLLG